MIDLHIHTTASDGEHTPTEVVMMAKNMGLRYIAITDHDSLSGLDEGQRAANQNGIGFIHGIEMSVQGNRELHILGYGMEPSDPKLLELCEAFKRQRYQREKRIFDYLADKGIFLKRSDVTLLTGGSEKPIARPHFAQAMVSAGYVGSIQEAFDSYLGTSEFSSVEREKPTAEHVIALIQQAGGDAVLAHPALLKLTAADLEALVLKLKDFGLSGIEAFYTTHTREQAIGYKELAEKYNLFVTGGSDFHGANAKPGFRLGGFDSDPNTGKFIIDKLKR